jgi:hypothetical protein
MEDKFIQVYLTDAEHVRKVYGCKNKAFLEKLLIKLKYPLEDLDDEFEDLIEPTKNSKFVLLDMINGKQTLKDLRLIYLYLYEKICLSFGQALFAPSDEFSVELFEYMELSPSAFMPIELSRKVPFLVSILCADLPAFRTRFEAVDAIFDEEKADYFYAIDKAIAEKKDLVLCMS